jgi:hypothetical protein
MSRNSELAARSERVAVQAAAAAAAAVASTIVQLDPRSRWNVCEHAGDDEIPGAHAEGYADVVPTGTHACFEAVR